MNTGTDTSDKYIEQNDDNFDSQLVNNDKHKKINLRKLSNKVNLSFTKIINIYFTPYNRKFQQFVQTFSNAIRVGKLGTVGLVIIPLINNYCNQSLLEFTGYISHGIML